MSDKKMHDDSRDKVYHKTQDATYKARVTGRVTQSDGGRDNVPHPPCEYKPRYK